MNEKRRGIWKAVVLAVLFMSAQLLLKEDGKVFAVVVADRTGALDGAVSAFASIFFRIP